MFQGDFKKFSQRTPKKISVLTSRDQLKSMVGDLEKEVGEMLVAMKANEDVKIKMEGDWKSKVEKAQWELDEVNKRCESLEKQLDDEKSNISKENKAKDELNKLLTTTKSSLEKANTEITSLQQQIDKLQKENSTLCKEKKTLDEEISKLKSNLSEYFASVSI